ncbi:MAG: hypothetical protein ACRDSS_03825 [Actinocrinis sp.]
MPSSTSGVADKVDPYGATNRRLAILEKEVKELRAARRLESATVGAGGLTIAGGGSLVITDNGALYVTDSDGHDHLVLGAILPGLPDGSQQYGLIINRQSGPDAIGGPALTIVTGTGVLPQTVGIYDNAGNNVFSDDGISGQGLARPYIPIPMVPYAPATWPSTTAAGWTPIWVGAALKQHPMIYMEGAAITPTGVSGQLRLRETGTNTVLGSVVTVTSAPTGINWAIGPAALPGAHMDPLVLVLEAQITTGAGAVSASVSGAFGRQS